MTTDTKAIRAKATMWHLPSGIADDILALCDALDDLRAENERLRANTTRFPELMASIVAAKDEPLEPRIEKLLSAMKKLPDYLHQYQWEADERQLFGDKWVRSVSGNNGQGRGCQAIACCPQHIEGLAEYIAAANPDTIARLISAALAQEGGE